MSSGFLANALRIVKKLEKYLKWNLFDNLKSLKNQLYQILSKLISKFITSVTGWDFILHTLSVAKI